MFDETKIPTDAKFMADHKLGAESMIAYRTAHGSCSGEWAIAFAIMQLVKALENQK